MQGDEIIWNNTAQVCGRREIRYTYWQTATTVAHGPSAVSDVAGFRRVLTVNMGCTYVRFGSALFANVFLFF